MSFVINGGQNNFLTVYFTDNTPHTPTPNACFINAHCGTCGHVKVFAKQHIGVKVEACYGIASGLQPVLQACMAKTTRVTLSLVDFPPSCLSWQVEPSILH